MNNREFYLEKINLQNTINSFTIENALKSINDNLLEASIIRNTWE